MKIVLCLVLTMFNLTAFACPFCNSETAAEIRTSLFGPDLWFNLCASLLPFLFFFIITFLIYNGGWKRKPDNQS